MHSTTTEKITEKRLTLYGICTTPETAAETNEIGNKRHIIEMD